jgi:hypothetical protein
MNLPSIIPGQECTDPDQQTCVDGNTNGATGGTTNESSDAASQANAGETTWTPGSDG